MLTFQRGFSVQRGTHYGVYEFTEYIFKIFPYNTIAYPKGVTTALFSRQISFEHWDSLPLDWESGHEEKWPRQVMNIDNL